MLTISRQCGKNSMHKRLRRHKNVPKISCSESGTNALHPNSLQCHSKTHSKTGSSRRDLDSKREIFSHLIAHSLSLSLFCSFSRSLWWVNFPISLAQNQTKNEQSMAVAFELPWVKGHTVCCGCFKMSEVLGGWKIRSFSRQLQCVVSTAS